MSISSPEQFEKLRACGMIVGKALRAMAAAVRPAITTAELCEIGSRVLAKHGARSSPPMVYGFPGDVCISVNDEVVHLIAKGNAPGYGGTIPVSSQGSESTYAAQARTVPTQAVRPIYASGAVCRSGFKTVSTQGRR